jgi:hypothetical protein
VVPTDTTRAYRSATECPKCRRVALARLERRGRDSNPRRTQRPETVFETA